MLLGAKLKVLDKLVKLFTQVGLGKRCILCIYNKLWKGRGAGEGSQGPSFMPESCTGMNIQVHITWVMWQATTATTRLMWVIQSKNIWGSALGIKNDSECPSHMWLCKEAFLWILPEPSIYIWRTIYRNRVMRCDSYASSSIRIESQAVEIWNK